jgi:hypothetical protein
VARARTPYYSLYRMAWRERLFPVLGSERLPTYGLKSSMLVPNHRCKDFKCQRHESQVACPSSGLERCRSAIPSTNVHSIDLSNTAVTVKGILISPLPPRCTIQSSQGQFSTEEIERFRTKHTTVWGTTPEQTKQS